MADPVTIATPAAFGAYVAWREFLKPWLERRKDDAGHGIEVLQSKLEDLHRRVLDAEEQLRHVPNEDTVATWMATTTETIRQLTAAVSEAVGLVKGMTNARRGD